MAAPESADLRINDRIRAREVRLVDPDGNQLGIKPLPEALSIAREMDLDLVEVAPLADPPVCRILNYGKWKYEAAQREKESRRKASNTAIKEMKYRPKIGGGDFDTKTRKVSEFIDQGHKVKITIMFRGREVAHPELGKRILDRIAEQLATAKVEAAPKLDGRNMIMVLAPDRRAKPPGKPDDQHRPSPAPQPARTGAAQSPGASPAPQAASPAPQAASPAPQAASPAPQAASPAPQAASPAPQAASPAPQAASPAPQAASPAPQAAPSVPAAPQTAPSVPAAPQTAPAAPTTPASTTANTATATPAPPAATGTPDENGQTTLRKS